MSNKIKSPTQKQGNQVNSPCIPALPRVGHNIDWCIILQHSNLNRKTCQNPKRQNDIHNQPRGPTRLKSRTLDSEINRNQTRNQEITREISEFWNQNSEITQSFVIIEPTVYMTAVTHRNQEIGLEIRKSHCKSTEIRLEINRNPFRNQQKSD
jgi:hypothetical protein